MKISDFKVTRDKIRKYTEEFDFYRSTVFETNLGKIRKTLYYCERFVEYIIEPDPVTRISMTFRPPERSGPVTIFIDDGAADITTEEDLDRKIASYTLAKELVTLLKELTREDYILWDIPKWDKKSLREAGYDFNLLV